MNPVTAIVAVAFGMSQVAALAMHIEALWLIGHWSYALDPATVRLSRRRHLTAIALEEMRRARTFSRGVVRLCSEGSLASQFVRPFAFVMHIVRRNIWPPYWRTLRDKAGV